MYINIYINMSEDFKRQVQEYIQIDNDLKKANDALKKLRTRKTQLQNNINKYMLTNEIDELKLNDCKLKTYISTSTGSLTSEWIYQRLLLICDGDQMKAQQMCDFICDKKARPKTQKNSLRRIKNKQIKSKS